MSRTWKLTRRGEKVIETTLGILVVGVFVTVLSFAGWIEGGMQ
jgi:hypothetical protein